MSRIDHLSSVHRGARIIKHMQYGGKLKLRKRYEKSDEIMTECAYRGVCDVHPKGQGCQAYCKRCNKYQKIDFAIVSEQRGTRKQTNNDAT